MFSIFFRPFLLSVSFLLCTVPVWGQSARSTPSDVQLETDPREYSDAEVKLLQELDRKRTELDRRAQAIELREKLVDLVEGRLIKQVAEMDVLKRELEKLLRTLSEKEESELKQLSQVYSSMKPQAAAKVLDRLDNTIVYDLFKRMPAKKTAKIMEKMDPAKARFISEMLTEKAVLPAFNPTQ